MSNLRLTEDQFRAISGGGKPPVSEHEIQCAFVRVVRAHHSLFPELRLGHAVPNAGAGAQAGQAGKLKAEGVEKGVPDWHLPLARKSFAGLWIEFKRPGGRLSDEQREFIRMLRNEGHFVEVCTDAAEAWERVRRYVAE